MRDKEFVVGLVAIMIAAGLLFGMPQYCVWQQGLSGEAKVRHAEQAKHITIERAIAEREAASLRAEAIQIIGKAAKAYPEYRNEEFMRALGVALRDGTIHHVMYVPTEANLPILHSGTR